MVCNSLICAVHLFRPFSPNLKMFFICSFTCAMPAQPDARWCRLLVSRGGRDLLSKCLLTSWIIEI